MLLPGTDPMYPLKKGCEHVHHHSGSRVPRNLFPRALRGYLDEFSLRHPIVRATLFGGISTVFKKLLDALRNPCI